MITLISKLLITLILSPLLFLGCLVYFLNIFLIGSPVIHTSYRTGYLEKPFKFYKFRTMKKRESQYFEEPLGLDIIVNNYAKFLRRCKLDELPQLFNILSNDLSLFGHRPLLHRQIDFLPLSARKIRRNIKPGLIGHSIISNKSQLERLQLDGDQSSIREKINLFTKTMSNFLYLEKNKDTILWDDFYIQNRVRLFKQNFSIVIDDGEMKIFSIEEKKITHEEDLGSELITAINNSEGYFFKSMLFVLIYDKNTNIGDLYKRFENRIFYFNKKTKKLYYYISPESIFLAKKINLNFDEIKIHNIITDLILEKQISINYPFKLEKD